MLLINIFLETLTNRLMLSNPIKICRKHNEQILKIPAFNTTKPGGFCVNTIRLLVCRHCSCFDP